MKAKLTKCERTQRRAVKIIKAFLTKPSRFKVKRAGRFPLLLRSQKQDIPVCKDIYIKNIRMVSI